MVPLLGIFLVLASALVDKGKGRRWPQTWKAWMEPKPPAFLGSHPSVLFGGSGCTAQGLFLLYRERRINPGV